MVAMWHSKFFLIKASKMIYCFPLFHLYYSPLTAFLPLPSTEEGFTKQQGNKEQFYASSQSKYISNDPGKHAAFSGDSPEDQIKQSFQFLFYQ